jgi:photoactive yellow protein
MSPRLTSRAVPLLNIGNLVALPVASIPLVAPLAGTSDYPVVMGERSRPEGTQTPLLCAWCGRTIRGGPGPPIHGICAECLAGELPTGPLAVVPAELLEGLPFGVIRLTGDGLVEAYNDTEARFARRSAASVIGKHFFNEVAPCTNVQAFAGRLASMRERGVAATERFAFVFRLPWTSCLVQLALTYDPAMDRAVAIVDWSPGKGATV